MSALTGPNLTPTRRPRRRADTVDVWCAGSRPTLQKYVCSKKAREAIGGNATGRADPLQWLIDVGRQDLVGAQGDACTMFVPESIHLSAADRWQRLLDAIENPRDCFNSTCWRNSAHHQSACPLG